MKLIKQIISKIEKIVIIDVIIIITLCVMSSVIYSDYTIRKLRNIHYDKYYYYIRETDRYLDKEIIHYNDIVIIDLYRDSIKMELQIINALKY